MDIAEQQLTSLAAAVNDLLPDDFRRHGRKWKRTRNDIRQTLHFRRLRFSYGLGVVLFRVELYTDLAGSDGLGRWDIVSTDPARLNGWRLDGGEGDHAAALDGVRSDLADIGERLDREAEQGEFIEATAGGGPSIDLLNAARTFGYPERLRSALSSGPPDHVREQRAWHARLANAALSGYEWLETEPSSDWVDFAHAVHRSFRGRPRKVDRAAFEALGHHLDALD